MNPNKVIQWKEVDRGAIFSPCRRYRYALTRRISNRPGRVMFIGLNPSTADEIQDDPTIRRCMGFVRDLGFGQLIMTNLFAFRATDPRLMKDEPEPIGPDNDEQLIRMAKECDMVIAAWGFHGDHMGRDKQVMKLLPTLHCLGVTAKGHPRHPLYLPKTARPLPYEG